MPMEKSFTPNCDPEQFEQLLGKDHELKIAAPYLVHNIMAYVRSTKVKKSNLMGDLKFFLN